MASIRRNNAIVNDIDKKGKSQELLEKMSLHWDDDLHWDSIFMQRSLSNFRAEEMLLNLIPSSAFLLEGLFNILRLIRYRILNWIKFLTSWQNWWDSRVRVGLGYRGKRNLGPNDFPPRSSKMSSLLSSIISGWSGLINPCSSSSLFGDEKRPYPPLLWLRK